MGDFGADTELEGAEGRYRLSLSRDWEVWGPNGGYLAAVALRAAGREARIQRPATFAAHYLRVADFAPVDLEVESVQRGRRSESLRVSMRQKGRPVLEAMVRTAERLPGLEHDTAQAPDVPGPEQLAPPVRQTEAPPYPFWNNFEVRPMRPDLWHAERNPEPPRFTEWLRMIPHANFDDPFIDAARALLLIDTMVWPAACRHHIQERYLAPNLDVAAWFHQAVEGHEWLLADAEAPIGEAGLIGGSVRVWGADRQLLASGGAQLLCIPAP